MVSIVHLTENDVALLKSMNAMFAEVFDDEESYASKRPSSSYLQTLLGTSSFIALAALDGGGAGDGLGAQVRTVALLRCAVHHRLVDLAGRGRGGEGRLLVPICVKPCRQRTDCVLASYFETTIA